MLVAGWAAGLGVGDGLGGGLDGDGGVDGAGGGGGVGGGGGEEGNTLCSCNRGVNFSPSSLYLEVNFSGLSYKQQREKC